MACVALTRSQCMGVMLAACRSIQIIGGTRSRERKNSSSFWGGNRGAPHSRVSFIRKKCYVIALVGEGLAMKRVVCIAMVTVSLLVVPRAAVAASVDNTFMILGAPGAASCGSWTQGRKDKGVIQNGRQLWVVGFFTAVSAWVLPADRGVSPDISEGTDVQGLFAWIDNYCAAQPLVSLATATYALTDELVPKWMAAHPPRK